MEDEQFKNLICIQFWQALYSSDFYQLNSLLDQYPGLINNIIETKEKKKGKKGNLFEEIKEAVPLVVAISKKDQGLVKFLLEKRADINCKMNIKTDELQFQQTVTDYMIMNNYDTMLELVLNNSSAKCNILLSSLTNTNNQTLKVLEKYWDRFCIFENETFIQFSIDALKEFNEFKIYEKNFPSLLVSNNLKNTDLEGMYKAIIILHKHAVLERLNYSQEDKSIFLKAINFKKWDALEIMLKAINGFKFDDNEHSLIKLVIMSADKVKNLVKVFAKVYGIDTLDTSGYNIFHYAVIHNNIKLVEIILKKQPEYTIKSKDDKTDKSNKTAYELANELENKTIFNLITEAKNKPTEKFSEFVPQPDIKFEIIEKIQKVKTNQKEKSSFLQKVCQNYTMNIINKSQVYQFLEEQGIDPQDFKKFYSEFQKQCEPEKIEEIYTWKIGNQIYKSNDKENVFCHLFQEVDEYYLTIDKTIKWDAKVYTHFKSIIKDKGFAKAELDCDGIKLINSVAEIKSISKEYGNIRPFAMKGYKNNQNKKIIIIDQVGDHEEVDRKVQNTSGTKLEIIELSGVTESSYNNEQNYSDN